VLTVCANGNWGDVQSIGTFPSGLLFRPIRFTQGANYAADKKRQATPVFCSATGAPAIKLI
jgi:hypothetical protein